MLDSVLLGDIEDHDELEESLREFDTQWYIGVDGDAEWKAAVLDNRPNLFSLGHSNLQVRWLDWVLFSTSAVHGVRSLG